MTKRRSMFYLTLEYLFALIVGLYVFYYSIGSVNLYIALLYVDVVMTVIIFLFSVIHDNSSVYDPYWSVIPPVLFVLWMMELNEFHLLSYIILGGIMVWSIRLTTNWARDYQGMEHEDFRYVEFRQQFKQFYWIISFLGVHLFPTLIVILAMYPLYYALENTAVLPVFVYLGVLIMIGAAVLSYIADEEVRKHKQNKENRRKACKSGVWSKSRHPNYLGELLFWLGCLVVSFGYGLHIYNFLGFIGMLILFNLYSVPKMEEKLLRNKVNYQEVMDTVPRLFPIRLKK